MSEDVQSNNSKKLFSKIKNYFRSEPGQESYYRSDAFWLYRWIMDWKYKRVGLTTITWLGEEYGYRMDVERIPKTQLDVMRKSTPYPVHKSNAGWKEWVMIKDDSTTPFPEVVREDGYYNPTAIDLYMYMMNKDLDQALTFRKKTDIPINGKMLVLIIAGVAVLALFLMGRFSS